MPVGRRPVGHTIFSNTLCHYIWPKLLWLLAQRLLNPIGRSFSRIRFSSVDAVLYRLPAANVCQRLVAGGQPPALRVFAAKNKHRKEKSVLQNSQELKDHTKWLCSLATVFICRIPLLYSPEVVCLH